MTLYDRTIAGFKPKLWLRPKAAGGGVEDLSATGVTLADEGTLPAYAMDSSDQTRPIGSTPRATFTGADFGTDITRCSNPTALSDLMAWLRGHPHTWIVRWRGGGQSTTFMRPLFWAGSTADTGHTTAPKEFVCISPGSKGSGTFDSGSNNYNGDYSSNFIGLTYRDSGNRVRGFGIAALGHVQGSSSPQVLNSAAFAVDPGVAITDLAAQANAGGPVEGYWNGSHVTAGNNLPAWSASYAPSGTVNKVSMGRGQWGDGTPLEYGFDGDLYEVILLPFKIDDAQYETLERAYHGLDEPVKFAERVAAMTPIAGVAGGGVLSIAGRGDSQVQFATSGSAGTGGYHAWGALRGMQYGARQLGPIVATHLAGGRSRPDVSGANLTANPAVAGSFGGRIIPQGFASGSGYVVGDVLTIVDGSAAGVPMRVRVNSVNGSGAVIGADGGGTDPSIANGGAYTTPPALDNNFRATTGGTGSGCNLLLGTNFNLRPSWDNATDGVQHGIADNWADTVPAEVLALFPTSDNVSGGVSCGSAFWDASALCPHRIAWLLAGTSAKNTTRLYHTSDDWALDTRAGFEIRMLVGGAKAGSKTFTFSITDPSNANAVLSGGGSASTITVGGAVDPATVVHETSLYWFKWVSVKVLAAQAATITENALSGTPYLEINVTGDLGGFPSAIVFYRFLQSGATQGVGTSVHAAAGGTSVRTHVQYLQAMTAAQLANLFAAETEWQTYLVPSAPRSLLTYWDLGTNDPNDSTSAFNADGTASTTNALGSTRDGVALNAMALANLMEAGRLLSPVASDRFAHAFWGTQSWYAGLDLPPGFAAAGFGKMLREHPEVRGVLLNIAMLSRNNEITQRAWTFGSGDNHMTRKGNAGHGTYLWSAYAGAVQDVLDAAGTTSRRSGMNTNRTRESDRILSAAPAGVASPQTPASLFLASSLNPKDAVEGAATGARYIDFPEVGMARPTTLRLTAYADVFVTGSPSVAMDVVGVLGVPGGFKLEKLATANFTWASDDQDIPAAMAGAGGAATRVSPSSATVSGTTELANAGGTAAAGATRPATVRVSVPERYLGVAVYASRGSSAISASPVVQRMWE
jgi:hypothetical protein